MKIKVKREGRGNHAPTSERPAKGPIDELPRIYSQDQVEEIIKFVDCPLCQDKAVLWADLEGAAAEFLAYQTMEQIAPPPTRLRRLEQVASAATRLRTRIFGPPARKHEFVDRILIHDLQAGADRVLKSNPPTGDELPPWLEGHCMWDGGKRVDVRTAIEAVIRLEDWTKARCDELREQLPQNGKSAHATVSAKSWLIGLALPLIYSKHFGRKFGFSRSHDGQGTPSGPGIRFVLKASEPKSLGLSATAHDVANAWTRYGKKTLGARLA